MKAKFNSFLVLLALSSAAVHGAALTWSGGDGDWQNGVAGGWSAVWNNGTAGPPVVAADTGTFNGPGGTVSVKSAITTGAAALAFNGGNYNLSSASPFTITLGANAINLAASVTTDLSSGVTVARSGGPSIAGADTATSILNINNGAKLDGTSGNTAFINASTVNVKTGGVLENGTSWVVGNGTATVLNVSGGTVNVEGTNSNLVVCNSSTAGASGEVTLTSGAINVLATTTANTGVRFGANAANANAITGTFNLNGGILNTLGVFKNAANTGMVATFNFHGGTLKATRDNATFVANIDKAYVKSGGAIIDSNGKTVTIPQALIEDPSSTGGGLTKEGSGTLSLTGANTYTGATIINGGKLGITAPYNAITATTINNGGRLKVTSNGTTPSALGTVSVNTGGGFEFDLGTLNAANQPAVSVATLEANGNYTVDLAASSIAAGSYTITLLNFTSKTGSGTPSIGTLPSGVIVTSGPAYVGSSIQIGITAANLLTWSKGDGQWDTSVSNLNWNANASAYAEPAVVAFPDLLEIVNGVNDVDVVGTLSPLAVTISNAGDFDTNAYSFTGTGAISGNTGITKTGVGVVTFSNPNSYTGTLAINAGHVIKSGVDTTSGNITVADGSTFALSGDIADGSGQSVTVAGPGAAGGILASGTNTQRGSLQSVSGDNTWDGDIVLSGTVGTGGNTRIGVQNGASLTLNGNISEGVVGMSPFFRGGDTGTLTLNGVGSWTGPTRLYSDGGAIKLGGNNRFPTGSLLTVGTSSGPTTLDLAGNSQTVAGFDGAGAAKIINTGGASTLTSNPASAVTFSGVIQNTISLVIGGAAIQSLSGDNTYTGNTTVGSGAALTVTAAGELRFYPTTDLDTNAVGGTGTLQFDGTLRTDLSGADSAAGNSWTLVNKSTLAATFGTTFTVADATLGAFTETALNSGIWKLTDSGKTWTFTESDGKLAVADALGYSTWQAANGTSQTVDGDHDSDGVDNGVEYFLGGNTNTTGFTALPVPVGGTVTWTKAAGYTGTFGTDFKVQTSTDLTTWADAPTSGSPGVPGTVFNSGSNYTYTMPTGPSKTFVRLLVNPN
jgi:autotransporter-associated beta strand protein